MKATSSPRYPDKQATILPWLHLLGGALVVVVFGLFAAVNSPLGLEISAGESPGFSWLRDHIVPAVGLVLVYLILVCRLQISRMGTSGPLLRILAVLVCVEVAGIALIAVLLFKQGTDLMPWAQTAVLVSILMQCLLAYLHLDRVGSEPEAARFPKPAASAGLFLVLLFVMGAGISLADPSWRRMSDQVLLDSGMEYNLRLLFPPALSGVTSGWFGIGMLAVLLGFNRLRPGLETRPNGLRVFALMLFFSLVAAFGALLLVTLYYAISWQMDSLNLKPTVWQLLLFLSGGVLFSTVFLRLAAHGNRSAVSSMIGVVALTPGAAALFPITWFLTGRRTQACWTLLLIFIMGACLSSGLIILFGDLFNPWFTTFSYLKGALLKVVSIVAAGTGVLLINQLFPAAERAPAGARRLGIPLVITALLGFLPYYALGRYPETKVAVLQFNELTRVDATFAREFANNLGLGKWIHLGQSPSPKESPRPLSPPLRLEKTHSSQLPAGFNLLVIVVDALRGDAFHSFWWPAAAAWISTVRTCTSKICTIKSPGPKAFNISC